MGMVADSVSEVINIPDADVQEPPAFGVNVNIDFVQGMGKMAGRVILLLDIRKVLATEELTLLNRIREEADGR